MKYTDRGLGLLRIDGLGACDCLKTIILKGYFECGALVRYVWMLGVKSK